MRIILIAGGALMLAACQPAEQQNAADNTAAELEAIGNEGENVSGNAVSNVQAEVLAMPDRTRNVVLVRAIMDSEQKCDGVERSERTQDQGGVPAWKAYCRDGTSHIVSITPDGTARVISPVKQ